MTPSAERANGVWLHGRETGPEEAPRLALIPSLGCDLRVWDGVAGLRADGARVLRYDPRGHGLSGIGEAPGSIGSHAADLAALLDARDARDGRWTLCGLSIGGQIALATALVRPDLVAGLVLCDTAARIGTPGRYAERIARIHAGGIAAIAEEQMARGFAPGFAERHPGAVAAMRAMLTRQPLEDYLRGVEAARDADLGGRLGAIRLPTLCLVGSEDRSTPPEQVRALARAIPGATCAEIEGAGHLPPVERPEATARTVAAFLAERAR